MRLAKLSAAAVLAASIPAAAQTPDFSKVEIKSEIVAPGVAVLFGAGGNIGLSYGEDGSVLIDDQFAPLTDKIVAAVAAIGAKPVKYLVNTHWHFDHSGGNENLDKTRHRGVEFTLDYEFNASLLDPLAGPVFQRSTSQLVDAFVRRAEQLNPEVPLTSPPENPP